MKTVLQNIYFVLSFSLLLNCTEEIPTETNFDSQIFITGSLNSIAKQISLRIQKSVPLDSDSFAPVNNAEITLFTKDQNGNTTILTTNFIISEGRYTNNQTIEAIVGNQYWIEVNIPNGDTFRSIPETLKDVVPIKKFEIVRNLPQISFDDPEDQRNFYLLSISYIADFEVIETEEIVVNDILFNGLKDKIIKTEKIQFFEDLHVNFYNLNHNSYQYLIHFLQLKKQRDFEFNDTDTSPNELFSTPPLNIAGNMTNITKNEPALGNFAVLNWDTSFLVTKKSPN